MPPTISPSVRQVAFLGNFLPRRCGIATFTTDLTAAISGEFADLKCPVVAMNDPGVQHAYGDQVRFEIAESDLASYHRAADFLNVGETDVLCVQHEYGIFGGKAGSHVLSLLRELRMPIVTTLHTILGQPTSDQRRVMDELTRLSTRVVVMSQYGSQLLQDVHGVPPEKIDFIPHGIPDLPRTRASKAKLGVEGKSVILTFGLLSPDKGIEHVIEALPEIVTQFPSTVYVVVGATHPHVKERHGDSYRRKLALLTHGLGVDSHVVFHDRFVSSAELVEFLSAADIYVTPYLNMDQITSGTLAYALGAGKAVISTPYRYATELLADDRGVLVPSRDPAALAAAIVQLLGNPDELANIGARAAKHAQGMRWPAVARRYVESLERAKREHASAGRAVFEAKSLAKRSVELPNLRLDHLRLMTDSTGLLQHARYSVPRYEDGYCLDDNARALVLMSLLEDAGTEEPAATRVLASRYLAFVAHAFDAAAGCFRNFMSYERRWLEASGSDDSQGRGLWALGTVVGRSKDAGRQSLAGDLFRAALPRAKNSQSPRGWAFALLGIGEYLRAFQGESAVESIGEHLSSRLHLAFERNSAPDWPWCEDVLTYDNARLPQALIVSGVRMANSGMTATGLEALDWLAKLQCSPDGCFAPVGSNGFYRREAECARFDQQPLEACAMVAACRDALSLTGEARFAVEMQRAYRWFLGRNDLGVALYDPANGGCCDGLHADRPNRNQGAESTLSFLLALTDLRMFESEVRLRSTNAPRSASLAAESAAQ